MSLLLERVRRALSPHFTISGEIAGGGMGVVFLGHDVALDRPVAVKILRPELATAVGAERFLREARILARLRHPNVVPVYQGGEVDGLLYHVLEYQPGGTLADRLARGPLTRPELERLAEGLLAALSAAHAEGIVHRDIKPSNIFFTDGRTLVGDFGIARTDTVDDALTNPGEWLGTLSYMAPEQYRGEPATPKSDLYSAALVLFEAATGTPLPRLGDVGRASWRKLPRGWESALRRALVDDPLARWDAATAFHQALRRRRPTWVAPLASAALLGVVMAVALSWPDGADVSPHRFVLGVAALAAGEGIPADQAAALRTTLVRRLTGYPDFAVQDADRRPRDGKALWLSGTVRAAGNAVAISLELRSSNAPYRALLERTLPAVTDGPGLDSLVHDILVEIWRGDHQTEALPSGALPRTVQGFGLFLAAERHYAGGAWQEALATYENAERLDTSCVLCGYRIRDLHRWLNRDSDPSRLAALLRARERFTPPYRALLDASALPPRERLDSLRALRGSLDGFFDFHYLLGDELFHRGPLYGFGRRESLEHFQRAAALRPDFSGVVEHLAWALTAEGDSAGAAVVLARLQRDHPVRDQFTAGLRALHRLGFAWRFLPTAEAAATTRGLLAAPEIAGSGDLAAGPRVLPAFGAPRGAVEMGALVASISGRPDLERVGWLAQALGWVALGRPDSAASAAGMLAATTTLPEWDLAALQVSALPFLAGAPANGNLQTLQTGIRNFLAGARGDLARRADWLARLLAPPDSAVGEGEDPLALILDARRRAAGGDVRGALRLTDSLDPTALRDSDPLARGVVRLLRSEWMASEGRIAAAVGELVWVEHADLAEIPRGDLQAADVDWALATVAAWRMARLLEREAGPATERCRGYGEVVRRWAEGAEPYRQWADTARSRRAALRCPG